MTGKSFGAIPFVDETATAGAGALAAGLTSGFSSAAATPTIATTHAIPNKSVRFVFIVFSHLTSSLDAKLSRATIVKRTKRELLLLILILLLILLLLVILLVILLFGLASPLRDARNMCHHAVEGRNHDTPLH